MIRSLLTFTILLGAVIEVAFGHGGGLDSNGGHNDRKNGGYHYHRRVYSSGRSNLDSVVKSNPAPRTAPRTNAKDQARSRSRARVRASGRTVGRAVVPRTTDWEYHSWDRGDDDTGNEEPESETDVFEERDDTPHEYLYLEQHHAKFKDLNVSRFVIAYDGENRPVRTPPHVDSLEKHLKKLHFKRGTVLYYLNGMNMAKTAWAHAEVHDSSVDVRKRSIDPREFQEFRLIVDRYPLRKWKDNTGKHSTSARFLSYSNFKVTLRKENGRRTDVKFNRLSKEDQRYVDQLRKSLVKASR